MTASNQFISVVVAADDPPVAPRGRWHILGTRRDRPAMTARLRQASALVTMKAICARKANHEFSDLLSRVERGEEILIIKRNKPVAVLRPYRPR
jgi:prevent-host-death family protein